MAADDDALRHMITTVYKFTTVLKTEIQWNNQSDG